MPLDMFGCLRAAVAGVIGTQLHQHLFLRNSDVLGLGLGIPKWCMFEQDFYCNANDMHVCYLQKKIKQST
jgi:hypothetical protein